MSQTPPSDLQFGETQGASHATTRNFYCHKCNINFSKSDNEATHGELVCPRCNHGFVEEILESDFLSGSNNSPTSFAGGSRDGSRSGSNAFDPSVLFNILVRTATSGAGGGNNGGNRSSSNSQPGAEMGAGPQLPSGGPQPMVMGMPMDNLLQQFLSNLMVGLGGGNGNGGGLHFRATAQPNIPFLTNIGDYVWGQNGLDAIVTQLMNQMEGTSGAPPMDEEKINQLRDVCIEKSADSSEGKGNESSKSCAVCWDDFKLNEKVKQLDCDHIFHSECILPWLRLHGTCPVCRKDFTSDSTSTKGDSNDTSGNAADTNRRGSNAEGSSSAAGSREVPNSRSNSNDSGSGGGRRFDNLDFEFD